jgi:hypothetical protein
MSKGPWVLSAVVAAVAAALACSSSNGSGGPDSCVAQQVGSVCLSCAQDKCGQNVTGYESACADYLSCICPGGTLSSTAKQSSACQAKNTTACGNAAQTVGACAQQNCNAQCYAPNDGG